MYLYSVVLLTPVAVAISLIVYVFCLYIFNASSIFFSSLVGLPPFLPLVLAAVSPALIRSTIRSVQTLFLVIFLRLKIYGFGGQNCMVLGIVPKTDVFGKIEIKKIKPPRLIKRKSST
jgi:hypothetical protein